MTFDLLVSIPAHTAIVCCDRRVEHEVSSVLYHLLSVTLLIMASHREVI